ncbi:Caudovirales tail fibre assembly protein [Citrobacter freundii]|nr:Caudovirales tail fibre assembly protein [Citrobacter freundii]
MFAGKKSAQIREILISESAWEEMTCLFAPSLADAEAERGNRMAEVTTRIDWLEDAQKDGDISSDEETELAILRAYRTALRRLDLSSAPDINWPEVPEYVA